VATWQDVVALGLRLPEAEESTTYRQPALKVRGRTFAWLSPHENGALVLRCDLDERAVMIESQPHVFWTTPHYAGHPMVLVHLDAIGDDELLDRIAESWLLTAPPRLAATLAPAED
jgi:hypothetical protein